MVAQAKSWRDFQFSAASGRKRRLTAILPALCQGIFERKIDALVTFSMTASRHSKQLSPRLSAPDQDPAEVYQKERRASAIRRDTREPHKRPSRPGPENRACIRAASDNICHMPALASPRHEKFAQAVASGKSASEAYRQSGANGKNADVHAARLMVNDGIRKRVAELKAAQCQKSRTIERLGSVNPTRLRRRFIKFECPTLHPARKEHEDSRELLYENEGFSASGHP